MGRRATPWRRTHVFTPRAHNFHQYHADPDARSSGFECTCTALPCLMLLTIGISRLQSILDCHGHGSRRSHFGLA
eukprot:3713306-Prymnesium_polylepis.1